MNSRTCARAGNNPAHSWLIVEAKVSEGTVSGCRLVRSISSFTLWMATRDEAFLQKTANICRYISITRSFAVRENNRVILKIIARV